jgi:hypothetical protein
MSNNRLTKSIRSSLLNDLLAHAFKARCEAQYDAELVFVEQVWDAVYGKHQELIDSLPSGFLGTDGNFKVAFGNDVTRLDFDTGIAPPAGYGMPWRRAGVERVCTKDRTMPYAAVHGHCIHNFNHDSKIGKRYEQIKAWHEALVEAMDAAERTARSTLESVTSITKLVDIWPECAVFAEAYREHGEHGEQKALLPAISRDKLNSALDLPPPTAVVAGGTVVA